jgi:hypothetical protein
MYITIIIIIIIYCYYYGPTAFCWALAAFFSFLLLYTVGRAPQMASTCTQTSMPHVGFELTNGGRSVGIVRSRTKVTEFSFSLVPFIFLKYCTTLTASVV